MVEKRAAQAEADAAVWEQAASESASGYASGALMTLFDSISLTPSGDTQDFAYEGLVIQRDDAGHVERMYVKEGYGGRKTEFLPEQDENGRLYTASWAGWRGPLRGNHPGRGKCLGFGNGDASGYRYFVL